MPETLDRPPRIRLHAIVHGFVQGVGFRANTQRQAVTRAITGWVRNTPDGTVEVVAEGTEPDVKAFERFLRRGPSAAVVDRVDVTYSEATGEFSRFNIRY